MTKLITRIGAITLALGASVALAQADDSRRQAFAEARTAAVAAADADGNGTLNASEFTAFQDAMREKLRQLRFTRLDADGNGELTAEELAAPRGRRGHCGK